jgi:hypothetical protein
LSRLNIHCSPTTCGRESLREKRAETALRCAKLRVFADHLQDDTQLAWVAVQLRDFADLLEVAQRRGWLA